MVGDFAGHHLFVFQHDLGLQDGGTVDPVHYAVAANLRDKGGKVMRGNGEALSIEGNGALTGAMLVDERTELPEELFLSGELRTVLLLLFLYAVDVLDVVDDSGNQQADGLRTEWIVMGDVPKRCY